MIQERHLNITKDPETELGNVGIYRMQILGPRRTTISFSQNSHIGIQYKKAESKGKPLEMAVAIGVPETHIMAAAAVLPYGVDEFSIAGGLNQSPAKLTKCLTVNLEAPASAEIVIEGKILRGQRVKDGPFMDYSGIPKSDPRAHVFEAAALMFRDNPIFRGAAIGVPSSEDHLLFSLLSKVNLLDFHGSRVRRSLQNLLIRNGLFRSFQVIGWVRQLLRGNPN